MAPTSETVSAAPETAGQVAPNSSGPRIHEFRVSFIQAETNAAFLGLNTFQPLEATCIGTFDEVRGKNPPAGPLYLPWKNPRTSSFWGYYLGGPLAGVDGWKAWKQFVPLRRSIPLSAAADWLTGNVSVAGYLYPFGQTLVVSVTMALAPGQDGVPLKEFPNLVIDIRNREYRVKSNGEEKQLNLLQLADRGLDLLREKAMTPATPGPTGGLFSVVTVIRGSGVVLPEPVPNPPVDAAMQRVLWGLSSGSSTYAYDNLGPYERMAIPLRKGTPGYHVLYGSKRGRAVWFPVLFMHKGEQTRHPLGVYHRNLVACSTQVESLCGLILSAGQLAGESKLGPNSYPVLHRTVGVLNRLYTGAKETKTSTDTKKYTTYRTRSAKKQIAQRDGFIDAMNAVRSEIIWPSGPFHLDKEDEEPEPRATARTDPASRG